MIELDRVTKRYADGTVAVHELSLTVARGELLVLVGSSGCGKTTILKMVNRLVTPTTGRVLVDGEDVAKVRPVRLRRRIGYVIQSGGLFPHRTVRENVATVPALLGWEAERTDGRVDELLRLVGLDPQLHGPRYPHELSGGQRQRVGVARALAADPPVLLMDEPFGAVDPMARGRLQEEFARLQRRLGTTVLFVTHDVEEAVRLGDRIAVLRQGGYLEQVGTPGEVLGAPATEFVASFVGEDRFVRRLGVTTVAAAELEHPPVVRPEDRLADAGVTLAGVGARWAVVLAPPHGVAGPRPAEDAADSDSGAPGHRHEPDEAGVVPVGWLAADEARGHGTVRDRMRPMTATVDADVTLREALAVLLAHDAGWVAVRDDSRYAGVLTPNALHAAARRSLDASAEIVPAGDPKRWP